VPNLPDDRSPLAMAMAWVSRVTTISFEMVLPGLLGYWVDQKLGTDPLFLVIGVVLGLIGGMWHLVGLTHEPSSRTRGEDGPTDKTEP